MREIQLWCRKTEGSWGSRWGCFHVFKENDLLLMVEKINYCFLTLYVQSIILHKCILFTGRCF